MNPRVLAPLVLALLVSGCLVGQRSSEPDADTDGVPDWLEKEGWDLVIDRTEYPCFGDVAPTPAVESRKAPSNELREDTDADGVKDFDEFRLRGDPTKNDTDGDGLSDLAEMKLLDDPDLFAGGLLALNRSDSDRDCLNDGLEVNGFDVPGFGHRSTDPTTADTDEDRLTDPWEWKRSITDPTDDDTDDDGVTDFADSAPKRDLWLRFNFLEFNAKDLPQGAAGKVQLFWNLPTKGTRTSGDSGPFVAAEGQTYAFPENTPGLMDGEDTRAQLLVEFYAYIVDSNGNPTHVIDVNPFFPGQPLGLWIEEPESGQWRFRKADGNFTNPASQSAVETAEARVTFSVAFEDAPAP